MAKRKRLTPANPAFLDSGTPAEPALSPLRAAPIAEVAREASHSAAAEEMARTLTEAREGGRMVLSVPLEQVQLNYLVRDRIAVQDDEMRALKDSLRSRGQQTPVELVELAAGRYGLISGWRRCAALRALHEETGEARFDQVLALLRKPGDAAEAYQAMVEENEIRVGLSYFERARIVAKAVEQGVFDSSRTALQTLFASASRPRRSKIGSFLVLVDAFEGHLHYPEAISERLGLQLSRTLTQSDGFAEVLRKRAADQPAQSAADEIAMLESALQTGQESSLFQPASPKAPLQTSPQSLEKTPSDHPAPPKAFHQQNPRPITPGIDMRYTSPGQLVLEGHGVDNDLREALIDWLRDRSLNG